MEKTFDYNGSYPGREPAPGYSCFLLDAANHEVLLKTYSELQSFCPGLFAAMTTPQEKLVTDRIRGKVYRADADSRNVHLLTVMDAGKENNSFPEFSSVPFRFINQLLLRFRVVPVQRGL